MNMNTTYTENQKAYFKFLASKHPVVALSGFDVNDGELNSSLFLFQKHIVRWALRLGRAAIFASVGLGKTLMQLSWAQQIAMRGSGRVLILCPLAVAAQTVREGEKFGIQVKHVYEQSDVTNDDQIVITNYDRVHLFDPAAFIGVVLDESGILKHYSKTFFELTTLFKDTPYKLCCTATPAPNDYVELGNHSMFLGFMHFKDMLARWFVGEGDLARSARLKGHAADSFWQWLTSWAVCISKPGDLGAEYAMPGYDLPPIHFHEYRLPPSQAAIDRAWNKGELLPDNAPSATGFMRVKRESLAGRVEKIKTIVADIPSHEAIILWCDTNFEADALKDAFPEAIEVRGSHSAKYKEEALLSFSSGEKRIIITKSEIAGFGLNWQHCHNVVMSPNFSFEQMYQALGRVHRYGQREDVQCHMVYSDTESSVLELLKHKERNFAEWQKEMSMAVQKYGLFRDTDPTITFGKAEFDTLRSDRFTWYLGDCVQVLATLPENSVDLSVHSPPFSSLYIYSEKDEDVGNSATKAEFFEHYGFVIRELYRVVKPGRCVAIHVKDLPLFQNRDGAMGIDPFSDDCAAAFRSAGWILQSRITIEKDPVIEMQKTNSHGLLFKNWRERSEILRVGLPDYLLVFVKPGDCEVPVIHDPLDMTYHGANPPATYRIPHLPSRKTGQINAALPIWQEYANPNWSDVEVPVEWTDFFEWVSQQHNHVWTDIQLTDVLNYQVAKTNKDERHIAPMQLSVIRRIIHWKTNPGEVVLDPFGGLGSTGYAAIEEGRQFIGAELKPEYWRLGGRYLQQAVDSANRPTLWQWAEARMSEEQVRLANSD